MELIRNNTLYEKVVIVDGIGRSGKLDLANLISSFKGVEKHRMDNMLDLLPKLWTIGKLDDDVAVTLLRMEVDLHLYENMLSRGVNFRLSDKTSIFKYKNKLKYLRRLFEEEGNSVVERIKKQKPIFLNSTHDTLMGIDILLKSFGDKFYMVHVLRNPIDVIYSWNVKKFGNRIGVDPREIQTTIKYRNKIIPLYANDIKREYHKLNDVERIIAFTKYSIDKNCEAYKKLSDKSRVKLIDLDEFNENQMLMSKNIARFIGTNITSHTKRYINKPIHEIMLKNRPRKKKYIYNNISDKYIEILTEINNSYKEFKEIANEEMGFL